MVAFRPSVLYCVYLKSECKTLVIFRICQGGRSIRFFNIKKILNFNKELGVGKVNDRELT